MREADLAGPGNGPAAREGDVRHGVMGGPERTRAHEPGAGRQQAGDGMDGGHFQRFLEVERRQDARGPLGHHRLARAGRAREQHVVPARRRDLQGPPRELLAPDVREIAVHELRGVAERLRREDDGTRMVEGLDRFAE